MQPDDGASPAGAQKPIWHKRRFIGRNETPEHALTWRSTRQRTSRLCDWRDATMQLYPESGRQLRIAWTLEGLATQKGYAFISDSTLAKKLNIDVRNVQRGLKRLEDDGVIIRASVSVKQVTGWKADRRIWLSSEIIAAPTPATMTCIDTGHDEPLNAGYDSQTETKEEMRASKAGYNARLTSTQLAARRAANLRSAR